MLLQLRISLRYLFSKRKEKFISVITCLAIFGVAVSVMVLIVVTAVMSGFHNELKEKILGVSAHVNITDSSGIIYDYDRLRKKVLTVKYVNAAAPYIAGQVIVRTGQTIAGVHLRGIDYTLENSVTKIAGYLVEGVLPDRGDKVVVGEEFARHYNIKVGDTIEIYSPSPVADASLREIKKALAEITSALVVGIFNSGMYEYDVSLIYVPLDFAQKLFNLDNGVHGLALKLIDPDLAYLVKQELSKTVGYPYITRGWMDINQRLFAALQTEKRVMFILLVLAIVVAGTNIISTLVMMVMEKTKDIGILKSIGASNFSMASVFIFLGLIIGICGTSVGIGCGLGIVFNLEKIEALVSQVFGYKLFPPDIYYFQKIPVQTNFSDVFLVAVCAIILSILSAWYPAWKAARLSPVEATRYE